MVPKQRALKSYPAWPLAIDEQGLRRLYSELQNIDSEVATVRFDVEYSDNSSVENWSIDDLLADENASFRRIRTIAVRSKNSRYDIVLKIGTKKKMKDHDQEQFVSAVSLDVSGLDRQGVYVVQSLIEDRIKSFRLNRMSQGMILVSSLGAVLVSFFVLAFVLTPYLPRMLVDVDRATQSVHLKVVVAVLAAAIIVPIVFGIGLLFPDLEFLLGKGIERHQRLDKIKTNLFWLVLVGGGLSIIGGYIATKIP